MKFCNIIISSIFQITSLVFVIGYLLGVLNIYFSDKNNYCAMTYMYEYPQFVQISLDINNYYPQYGLYAYTEGRITENARKMWFSGIPVLFIPGNSGSHMQARSIASVALRKSLSRDYGYHFDFFTISYNEELSGLYGGVLQPHTKYAAACISKILSFYDSSSFIRSTPTTVIVIGHSMGGLIAKRLLAYPRTTKLTNIAITLAAPLVAPVINFDMIMNDYYTRMNGEWEELRDDPGLFEKKVLISIGSGPRDVLIPAGLTASNDSYINTLATSIPGVWVTPDHVSMVWCKQLVMVINKFLFDIVDIRTQQITVNVDQVKRKARQYFQANRSMMLQDPVVNSTVPMVKTGFWYEDNRRVYQISRPGIDRITYLMIRLVKFPQNRFVAVESVNVDDRDWIFGCSADQVYNTYRYCKEATPLTQLSRWTGAATDFGKRKLATIRLDNIMERRPDWTHVVVKVSPTHKPITLNVDINDHLSRQINVKVPALFSFSTYTVIESTEPNSLYYELLLDGFSLVHQAYLLYVEPSGSCQATQYHVSAEIHVPWAENNENYHYFTHLKRSPMKLRLFRSNPNVTVGLETTDKVKITLLLDPQCTFTVRISQSWYHFLAQMARNHTPLLVPYIAAILLLAARSNLMNIKNTGSCLSIHAALSSDAVKPYYILLLGLLGSTFMMTVPILAVFENASWKNLELQYFTRSLLVLPVYMTALGILHIATAAVTIMMVFSSQIAHRLLFRLLWRGGSSNPLAEKVAEGMHRAPAVVSFALLVSLVSACGAAALVLGGAFYAFRISQMYEEYLEDYVYKLMAKVGSRICRIFKSKTKENKAKTDLNATEVEDYKVDTLVKHDKDEISKTKPADDNIKAIEYKENLNKDTEDTGIKAMEYKENLNKDTEDTGIKAIEYKENLNKDTEDTGIKAIEYKDNLNKDTEDTGKSEDNIDTPSDQCDNEHEIDEDLNNLNFEMMMFFLWMCVTIVNIPALLTWTKSFTYNIAFKQDTSCYSGIILTISSVIAWQHNGPRRIAHYDGICSLLFTMAVIIIVLGPYSLSIVNYGLTYVFAIIAMQQFCSVPEFITTKPVHILEQEIENLNSNNENHTEEKEEENVNTNETSGSCDVCDENRIYTMFRNLKDKLSFGKNE